MSENMIPAGRYTAKAIASSVVWGESSKGNAQVGLSFEIVSGDYKGRRYPWYGSFAAGEATRITLDALEACGARFESDDVTDLNGLGEVECSIQIEHKVQQRFEDGRLVSVLDEFGNERVIPQIAFVNRGGGAHFKNEMSGDAKRSFADIMKDTIRARRNKRLGGANSSKGEDDKIPF